MSGWAWVFFLWGALKVAISFFAVPLAALYIWEHYMNPQINITADPREKITICLVGVNYEVHPPKTALALKLAVRAKQAGDAPDLMMAAVDEWITKAFGKTEAKKVQARLENETDDLDFPHIMQLMEALIEQATGTPTTSS